MSRWLLLLLPFLPLAGCANTHGQMMEHVEAGVAHEKAARDLERRVELAAAAERFGQSAVELERGLEVATERQNQVFESFITTKLSIVSSGQARCLEPKDNPQGSWEAARALYAKAEAWADKVTMLKLKANALCDQARCAQPDHDPQGSWDAAAALYAKAAKLCEGLEDDAGRGEALRRQALCLMKGDRSAPSGEARQLLVLARKLGDEEATAILAGAGASDSFCSGCGADRRPEDRFCRQCGRDQTIKPEEPPPPANMRGPNNPGGGPGGPGGPGGAGQ